MCKAIDPENLDSTIAPGSDFYHYANGGWLNTHPIPDEFSRYGTFDILREDNREIVRSIIEEVAENASDHLSKLVGAFYASGMDMDARNKNGSKPIERDFSEIEALASIEDVCQMVSQLYRKSLPTLFYIYPSPDREDSTKVIANLHQGGMGLSDVDYYRNDDERSKEIREKYTSYIAQMFSLSGENPSRAEDYGKRILQMESRLAHAGMTRIEQRDPHKTFNKRSQADLERDFPSFSWNTFFSELNLQIDGHLNINQPGFFKELSSMLSDTALEDWKIFLKWRLINNSASLLSGEFEEAKFSFYGKFLSGKKTLQPLWKRVTAVTEDALGEAIGKLFVKKYFPPEAKSRMLDLIENLRASLREKIIHLAWMSEDTKKEALEKLDKIRVKVGYPEKWRSYDLLQLPEESYYDMAVSASVFNQNFELQKIGKPVDQEEWHMTPQTVNAYYHPLLNEIVFPAGILQAPFFFKDADDAVNYGAIGVVIGHEMTHGFDDQGRKFDKNGNLNDWWSEADAINFSTRAKILEEQFNKMPVAEGLYADGKLSLGENIADLGGVNIAFDALKKAWEKLTPDPEIDGFTPEQRFFLSYAHIWANNIRKEEIIRLTKEDVHSLGINRVNGPLPNVAEFHKAFGIKPGDKMYLPENKRADIW